MRAYCSSAVGNSERNTTYMVWRLPLLLQPDVLFRSLLSSLFSIFPLPQIPDRQFTLVLGTPPRPLQTPPFALRPAVSRNGTIAHHGRPRTDPREPHDDAGLRVVCACGSEALGPPREACSPAQAIRCGQHLDPASVRRNLN